VGVDSWVAGEDRRLDELIRYSAFKAALFGFTLAFVSLRGATTLLWLARDQLRTHKIWATRAQSMKQSSPRLRLAL